MQLQQNIPTLGGLGEPPPRSRREQLAADGERSRREIGSVLARARRRALGLALARAGALLVSGLSIALLVGALVASVDGALFARIAAGALAFLAACGVVWFSLRSPLQRAAVRARDPRLLARLVGGPSGLLSSVELTREDPRGVSTELSSSEGPPISLASRRGSRARTAARCRGDRSENHTTPHAARNASAPAAMRANRAPSTLAPSAPASRAIESPETSSAPARARARPRARRRARASTEPISRRERSPSAASCSRRDRGGGSPSPPSV